MKKLLSAVLAVLIVLLAGCGSKSTQTVLHVAIPYSDHVQDPETNYYVNWLEERTGFTLDISLIRQTRSEDYLSALFDSEADIDIVMFGEDFSADASVLEKYVSSGDIATVNDTAFYLNYGSSAGNGVGQVLWINYEWLTRLNLPFPETTEDLKTVLKAFKEQDPNGNGIADEIPLVGAIDDYCYSPVEFILNAYVYNDPYHSRFDAGKSSVLTADTREFREGMEYLNDLYEEGLLDARSFSYSLSNLKELVNSPLDLVGAFTTDSISEVIYSGNTVVLSRFMHVLPLKGPHGQRNAMYTRKEPTVGAIITGRSNEKEAAKLLLDTMLTAEASLIARYGEEGTDWAFSEGRDVSISGGVSTIVTLNYFWNTAQNKNLNGIGPMEVPARYLEGVTWNGVNSDAEYIDGRAFVSYAAYLPKEREFHERSEKLSAYTDRCVEEFVTGVRNAESDEEWKTFLKGLEY